MPRREQIDPDTARVVEERLQWLLNQHGPEPAPKAGAARYPSGRSTRSSPGADAHGDLPRRSRSRSTPTNASAVAPAVAPAAAPVLAPTPSLAAGWLSVGTFRRAHVVVVLVVVALGLLLATWAVLRARPVAVAVSPPTVAASRAPGGDQGAEPGASLSASTTPVVVHVLGAVRKPGLVSLASGGRVHDALEAAGGLTDKADPDELNLAQPVTDGQQIVVGTKGKPSGEVRNGPGSDAGGSASGGTTGSGTPGGTSGGSSSGTGSGSAGQLVDLNTATQTELEQLPGVGPVMAGKILAWRTENGRFHRVEELQEIDGVGPKTYAKLAPLCRV